MKKIRLGSWAAHIGVVFFAALCAVLFAADITDKSDGLTWLYNATHDHGLQMTFWFIGLYFMYSRIFLSEKFSGFGFSGEYVFAAFCAVSFLFGDACSAESALSSLWNPWEQIFKSLFLLLCYFVFSLAAARWLNFLLCRFSFSDSRPSFPAGVRRLWNRHPFLFFFLAIFICWLPQLILKFPGTMCYDNYSQLAQYYNYTEFSSDHPPLHTLFLGLCFDVGLLFSSANLGLFIAVLLQTLLLAAVFAYTLLLMRRMHSPFWLICLSFGFYVISPNIIGYICLPVKDVLYSAFYVLFTVCTASFALNAESFWTDKKRVVLLVLAGVLLALLRHNGLITVFSLTFFMAAYTLLKNRKRIACALKRVSVLSLIFIFIIGAEAAIELTIHPADMNIGGALAFPFQQTARYVRDHSEDVTEEEAAIIDRVLDYNRIGKLYDPRIADAVKDTFKKESSLSDLAAYFGVWAKQFFLHPITYIEATVSQNYSLFYPQINNIKYYPSVHTHNKLESEMTETSGLHGLSVFDAPREAMTKFYTFLHNAPLVGTLSNPGFLTLFLLLLWVLSRHYKLHGMGLAIAPALLTVCMCIFAPVIMSQLRYAFPMIYSMPFLTAVYVFALSKNIRKAKEEPRISALLEENF